MAVPFLFIPLLCSLKFGESSQKQRKDKRERRDGKANASLAEVAWQIQGAVPYLRLEEAKKESAEKGGDQGKTSGNAVHGSFCPPGPGNAKTGPCLAVRHHVHLSHNVRGARPASNMWEQFAKSARCRRD